MEQEFNQWTARRQAAPVMDIIPRKGTVAEAGRGSGRGQTTAHVRTYWSAIASCLFLGGVVWHGAVQARMVEEQIDVPVRVHDIYGKAVEQPIKVTVWRDDANPAPAPVLVLNHGRAADVQGRAGLGRARFSAAARFFVGQGFIVAVPTRIGYGVTGGEDVEDSGSCSARHYPPAYKAAADQTVAALEAVRAMPYADRDRSVIVGISFGGATAIAVAALDLPGVAAAINFAGGGGGNPKTHPQRPCSVGMLESMFGQYGKTARIPTLWIYAQNDQWMGPTYPQQWFNAFEAAGGKGEFVLFPPYGDDGHLLFTKFAQVWQPRVKQFLEQNGLGTPARVLNAKPQDDVAAPPVK